MIIFALIRQMSGIYIHIPFCRKKCLYCDFYSGGLRIANWDAYITAVLNELIIRQNELKNNPSTLYIGGGTPSLIPEQYFINLINGIRTILKIDAWQEFTIEANPEDINDSKIKTWIDAGVTRISLGVQSLQYPELKNIGRNHDAQTALNAIQALSKHFNNISLDLMYGLPGQTIESYTQTLATILDFQPSHISSYSLMLEEGTALNLLVSKNNISLPDEESWLQMNQYTNEFLTDRGYQHYEISNYCRPGFESKHNSIYWEGQPYLGLGPGAHSYDGFNIRKINPGDIKGYINFYSAIPLKNKTGDKKSFYSEENLTEKELQEEMIMTRLRTAKGLNTAEFENKFGTYQKNYLLQKARKYIDLNYLKEINDRLILTPEGINISNSIILDLV